LHIHPPEDRVKLEVVIPVELRGRCVLRLDIGCLIVDQFLNVSLLKGHKKSHYRRQFGLSVVDFISALCLLLTDPLENSPE
jgi:hypothetical protein